MKNSFLTLIFGLFLSVVSAQNIVSIENNTSYEFVNCDGLNNMMFTGNPYSGATFQSINISLLSIWPYKVILNPEYFDQEWDLDESSELRFFDGYGPTANLLGTYNSTTHPDGFSLIVNTNSMRIELETGEGSSGNGFGVNILCLETFESLPTVKFKPILSEDWYFDNEIDMYVRRACVEDSSNLAIEPVYLNQQSGNANVDEMMIKWAMGDRTFKRDTGLTSVDHIYTPGSGYMVTVYSQEMSGAESYLKFMVRNSAQPEMTVNADQSFCLNTPIELPGGMIGNEIVGAEQSDPSTTAITEFFGTMLYLPDGSGVSYTTNIEVTGFPAGTSISSASDLAALCVNMEHSYLRDLKMMLTCPNGTEINIFNAYGGDYGSGNIFLGDALDDQSGLPGIGFDYCFSTDAEWGNMGEELAAGNTVLVSSFLYENPSMAPGTYQPEESFESFAGCPANGEWTLTVRDHWAIDDGFIFDWSLEFSDELYSSTFQNGLILAEWEPNDWISSVGAGYVEITPQNTEPNELIFKVADENGCDFSKVLTFQVTDTLTPLTKSGLCDFTYELEWPSALGELSFVSGPSADVNISNLGDKFEVEVHEAGSYIFELNYFDCDNSAQANLKFFEITSPACGGPAPPFQINLTADPGFQATDFDSLSIGICLADTFTVTAATSYLLSDSSGYETAESDSATYYNWLMGDGYTQAGFGLNEVTYAYDNGSGHEINLFVTDASNITQSYQLYVLQAPRLNFSNLALNDTVCVGSETVISEGISELNPIGAELGTVSILSGTTFMGPIIIPDANPPYCDVLSLPLVINEFEEGQTLNDISDIINICVNMHHRFLGDLEMGLVCPGGQDTLVLFDMRSNTGMCPNLFTGGTDAGARRLGEPTSTPIPIGYDYCFNNNPEYGAFDTVHADLASGIPMPTGSYQPMSPIEDLIGCPLNGEWQLIILDGWPQFEGIVHGWSLFFNPEINPSTEYYSPAIVSAGWDESPDLIVNEDSTSVTVAPSNAGDNSFAFWAYDEFGCKHDTVINIYVRSEINQDGGDICGLTQILNPYNDMDEPITDAVYSVISAPTSTGDIIFEQVGPSTYEAVATEHGTYEIMITGTECGYTDTAMLKFLEEDAPECITGIRDIDFNKEFVIAPNPAENYAEVKFEIQKPQNIEIMITTLDGKVVSKEKYHFASGKQSQRVSLDQVASGAYIITLLGDTFKSSGLLIKN